MSTTHRYVMKKSRYRKAIRSYRLGKIEWADRQLAGFRLDLRTSLRTQQVGRCYFCRQRVYQERRNATEDIEHYLDKSANSYRKWAFSPVNLTIACHPCNIQKGRRDLGDAAIKASVSLCRDIGMFRWLHPYFDDYHENIDILPGWVYNVKRNAPRAAEAAAMLHELELDQIRRIQERRQNLCNRLERACVIMNKLIERGQSGGERMKIMTSTIKNATDELRWS